jgi:hypothetical protein
MDTWERHFAAVLNNDGKEYAYPVNKTIRKYIINTLATYTGTRCIDVYCNT